MTVRGTFPWPAHEEPRIDAAARATSAPESRTATLSDRLREAIPAREQDALLLATRNLREFDTLGYGVRYDGDGRIIESEKIAYVSTVTTIATAPASASTKESTSVCRRTR